MANNLGFDDFFSDQNPDLINKKTMASFQKILTKRVTITGEVTWSDYVYNVYDSYVKPNAFFIIVLILLIAFLVYRYWSKSHSLNEPLDSMGSLSSLTGPITGPDECKVLIDESPLPTFNPYYPVSEQNSYVNYLPNTIPLYSNGRDVMPPSEEHCEPEYTPLTDSLYHPFRTYTGIAEYTSSDPMLPNALGWPADYNSTTDNALDYFAGQNRRNLDMLATIMFDKSDPRRTSTGPYAAYTP